MDDRRFRWVVAILLGAIFTILVAAQLRITTWQTSTDTCIRSDVRQGNDAPTYGFGMPEPTLAPGDLYGFWAIDTLNWPVANGRWTVRHCWEFHTEVVDHWKVVFGPLSAQGESTHGGGASP